MDVLNARSKFQKMEKNGHGYIIRKIADHTQRMGQVFNIKVQGITLDERPILTKTLPQKNAQLPIKFNGVKMSDLGQQMRGQRPTARADFKKKILWVWCNPGSDLRKDRLADQKILPQRFFGGRHESCRASLAASIMLFGFALPLAARVKAVP